MKSLECFGFIYRKSNFSQFCPVISAVQMAVGSESKSDQESQHRTGKHYLKLITGVVAMMSQTPMRGGCLFPFSVRG